MRAKVTVLTCLDGEWQGFLAMLATLARPLGNAAPTGVHLLPIIADSPEKFHYSP
jgi:hypothetical protein